MAFSQQLAGCDEGRHPSWSRRTNGAIRRLAARGVTSASALVEAFGSLPARERADGVYLLGRLRRKRDAPFLVRSFDAERSQKVKRSVIEALGEIGGKRALRALCRWAGDRELALQHRHAACYQLAFFGDGDEALVESMLALAGSTGEDPLLRGQAIEALAYQVGSADRRRRSWRRAAELLERCLNDPAGEVRFWAIFALGSLGAVRALGAIRAIARRDGFVGSMGWSNREEAADMVHLLERGEWPEPSAADRVPSK